MIEQENLNIDAICEYFDGEVSKFAGCIEAGCDEETTVYNYKVLDDSDFLLFDVCKKDDVIDAINECLDDMAITDFEIDYDTDYINFIIA